MSSGSRAFFWMRPCFPEDPHPPGRVVKKLRSSRSVILQGASFFPAVPLRTLIRCLESQARYFYRGDRYHGSGVRIPKMMILKCSGDCLHEQMFFAQRVTDFGEL